MKKALIVVSHGSRREASNEELRQLVQQLSTHRENSFEDVSAAFLELAEPSIPDGIMAAIERGADEVTVLPFFLSAGRHVTQDIPVEVDKARRQKPHAVIRIAPYIGRAPEMAEIVLRLAKVHR